MSDTVVPKHIAVILDGNRRYARKKGMLLFKGHEQGARNVGRLFEWCEELGISQVTLYAFSTENFNRDPQEVKYLMDLVRDSYERYKKRMHELRERNVRIRVIGDVSMFPDDIQEIIEEVVEYCTDHTGLIVNFALGYGSRAEIVNAVKTISSEVSSGKLSVEDITDETVTSHLYLADEPDLLIRPGGEKRLSNYLLWQLSYAELFFVDKMWPEFTKEDLISVIDEFNDRERRFGK